MMRILLVEDEENIRDVVKLNLEMEDYEVVATDNGSKNCMFRHAMLNNMLHDERRLRNHCNYHLRYHSRHVGVVSNILQLHFREITSYENSEL